MKQVERHFYALIEAMIDVGRSPDEIRAGLKAVTLTLSPPKRGKK